MVTFEQKPFNMECMCLASALGLEDMFIVVYGDMSLVFWWFSVKFHGD